MEPSSPTPAPDTFRDLIVPKLREQFPDMYAMVDKIKAGEEVELHKDYQYKTCPKCGKRFLHNAKHYAGRKYCSRLCAAKEQAESRKKR